MYVRTALSDTNEGRHVCSCGRAKSRRASDKSRTNSFVLRANRETLSHTRSGEESPFCNLDREHGARTLFRPVRSSSDKRSERDHLIPMCSSTLSRGHTAETRVIFIGPGEEKKSNERAVAPVISLARCVRAIVASEYF